MDRVYRDKIPRGKDVIMGTLSRKKKRNRTRRKLIESTPSLEESRPEKAWRDDETIGGNISARNALQKASFLSCKGLPRCP